MPLVKIVASALTIGSGGSGGREGPIAQIGAGFGSILAGLLGLRTAERRVLLAAGMGAGIAAVFRAPLAGALFAAEVLYWSPEFEPEVIMPAGIASVISYCVFGTFAGWSPLFQIPAFSFKQPRHLIFDSLLIVAMILLASLYVRTFYGVTRLFHRLPIPRTLKPALGGLISGLIGVGLYYGFGREQQLLAVLSFGYQSLQASVSPDVTLGAGVLAAIAIGKIFTTSMTIGSGGSGGVFGPSMVIGGCGAGAVALLCSGLGPDWRPEVGNCVIVGMAAFFAAVAKTPFSTLIMVSEMTGGYDLLLPTLWVCVLGFMLSDNRSIYSSQVESRSLSPAHQGNFARNALQGVFVRDFFKPLDPLPVVRPQDTMYAVARLLEESDLPVLPVVDLDNRLLGVIDAADLRWNAAGDSGAWLVADDVVRTDVDPLELDFELDRALALFIECDLLALPVVDNSRDRRVIGVVRRADISSGYVRRIQGNPAPLG